jgi:hypothetical protein
MSDVYYGKAVDPGTLALLYTSPSALDKGDVAQPSGCPRRWHAHYVLGIRDPSSKAAERGTEYHDQIRHYETTGQDVLAAPPRSALHAIPDPGPDLLAEWPLIPPPPGAVPDAEGRIVVDPRGGTARLVVAGVPVVGFVDLAHARATNKGGTDVGETRDPPGTVEVLDWKFTGDLAKKLARTTPDSVAGATPMLAYGHAVARAYEAAGLDVRHVRLSHVLISMGKREPARKVTRLLTREEVARGWEAREPLVRLLRDAARERDYDRLPVNTAACRAYNRACPNLQNCSAGQYGSLARVFNYGKDSSNMNVIDIVKPPAPPAASVLPPSVGVAAALAIPPTEPPRGPTFAEAWDYVERCQVGTPSCSGAAANALSAAKGWAVPPGTSHNGTGQIAVVRVSEVAEVGKIAAELAGRRNDEQARAYFSQPVVVQAVAVAPSYYPAPTPVAPPPPAQPVVADPATPVYAAERAAAPPPPLAPPQAPGTTPILPPDAPASQPHLAALPVQPTPAEVASGAFPPITQPPPPPGAVTPPGAPPGAVTPAAPVASSPPPGAQAEAPKRGRGRPKKDAVPPGAAVAQVAVATCPAPAPVGAPTAISVGGSECDGIEVFVDAVPSCEYVDLAGKVDEWAAALAAAFPGTDDVRCAPDASPLGFGKWKGGFSAYVDARVRDGDLPPGTYVLFARRSELCDVAAAAIRKHCSLFVRGV